MRSMLNFALVVMVLITAGSAIALESPADPTPWRVSPSVAMTRQDLSFRNGDVVLRGVLHLPATAHGRVPAVVVTHAASYPTHDMALYRHLTEMAPALGVAVFVYDRRGSGASGGVLEASDYDTLAADAVAAAEMLGRMPTIDSRRIGYWGLSQGGWLAVLAATRDPRAAFAVSVSAPMTTPADQMNFAVGNILRIRNFSDEQIKAALNVRRIIDEYYRGDVDAVTANAALAAARNAPWFRHTYIDAELEDRATARWTRDMAHDPLETLHRLTVPTLIIYGGADPWVPVKTSVARLAASPNPKVETRVITGADHAMMLSIDEATQIDPESLPTQAPEAVEYFSTLAAWLGARLHE